MADAAALAHSTQAPAPRVVLDSNIWVDILIFDDAVARPIRAALEAGRLDAIISPACREELRRVLGYPQFARYAVDTQAALAWVDRVTRSVADPERSSRAARIATTRNFSRSPMPPTLPISFPRTAPCSSSSAAWPSIATWRCCRPSSSSRWSSWKTRPLPQSQIKPETVLS